MMLPIPSISVSVFIAQAGGGQSSDVLDVLLWGGVLVAIVVVGWIVVLRIRRSIHASDSDVSTGFTLQDLREMHARGEISTEEFEQARESMIRNVRKAATSENAPPDENQQISDS